MSHSAREKMLTIGIRTTTLTLIVLSIIITYYVKVVQKDYVIFTNPDGPETADYFEELFAE